MKAFNKSSLILERRSWLKRRGLTLLLTMAISIALFIAIGILIAGQAVISFIKQHLVSKSHFLVITVIGSVMRWIVIIVIFFVTVLHLVPVRAGSHKKRWKFVNPGSVLATGLAILTSIGFLIILTISPRTTKCMAPSAPLSW
jgi:membrane protein